MEQSTLTVLRQLVVVAVATGVLFRRGSSCGLTCSATGVPLGLRSTCWPCGYSMQWNKPCRPWGEAKQESGCPTVGMKGRVPFEAGDALLALPIASTAGTFLLPPFWQFAVEQIEVEAKTQIQCCEATADAKYLHGRPGRVQELLQDEELLLVFKQVGVCYPRIILYVFVVVLISVPVCSLIRCV